MKKERVTKESLAGEVKKLRRKNAGMVSLIEKLRKAEEKQKRGEEMYRALVESTEDSIYLVDRDGVYLFINRRHLKRMGLPKRQLIGRAYGEFHSEVETKWFMEKVKQVLETGNSVQHEHRSLRDGRDFLRTFSPVKKGPRGKTFAVTVVSKDVTKLKRMEEKLHFLSVTDELTG
ncbi:MAG TPA: PAS domain S-box protein, partial [Thermodesulfovibrionales bacterium]|nr:PAS domain S-box protein [Thermodesulfovibrionales bacterium]